jgi:hypothetical protein
VDNSYEDKVAHLTGTSGGANGTTYIRANIEVTGDNVKDVLDGGGGGAGGRDLWYANSTTSTKDELKNLGATDTLFQIT